MQKETNFLTETDTKEPSTETEAQNTISSTVGENNLDVQSQNKKEGETSEKIQSDDSISAEFEELIKGPYKAAFTKKVQGIINKRFKEQKMVENKEASSYQTEENLNINSDKESSSSSPETKTTDSVYDSLIAAGIDSETAYRVLHLDEIMDSSMRYGAELAAKQLTDSLRKKSTRPYESALSQRGYSAKTTASNLTPEKRKELAKKALMGEQIGF